MKTTIRHILSTLAFAAISTTAQAQIGYQVSLLNTATGEPRANVTVNAQVTITDSQDNTILNVPVAEVANKLKSSFTKEDLVGTWVHLSDDGYDRFVLTFKSDNTVTEQWTKAYGTPHPETTTDEGKYEIDGNTIYCYEIFSVIRWTDGRLWDFDHGLFTKQ